MPETVSPEVLEEALEGRVFVPFGSAEAELVALARACQQLSVPGPSAAAERRLLARVRPEPAVQHTSWWQGGRVGAMRRPLLQRFAAAAVAVLLVGGGASAATGVTPAEAAQASANIVRSIVLSLDPRDDEGGSGATSTPTPTTTAEPSASPSPAETPVPAVTTPPPASTAAAGTTPTADPDPEPGDDGGDDDDNSGRGSDDSGDDESGGDDSGGDD